jgi:hypothetical protein
MAVTVQWPHIGVGAVIVFLLAWLSFGLLTAVVLALIVLVLLGYFSTGRPRMDWR